jgi:hypothetical protein
MPNWVYTNMLVCGKDKDVVKFRNAMAKPFEYKMLDTFSNEMKTTLTDSDFTFFNVIAPSAEDMDKYGLQPKWGKLSHTDPGWWDELSQISQSDESWYHWNNRNWGTKWDASNVNVEKLRSITPYRSRVLYKFETPWDAPSKVFVEMAKQWPQLSFFIRSLEETGWGKRMQYKDGAEVLYNYIDEVSEDFLDELIRNR